MVQWYIMPTEWDSCWPAQWCCHWAVRDAAEQRRPVFEKIPCTLEMWPRWPGFYVYKRNEHAQARKHLHQMSNPFISCHPPYSATDRKYQCKTGKMITNSDFHPQRVKAWRWGSCCWLVLQDLPVGRLKDVRHRCEAVMKILREGWWTYVYHARECFGTSRNFWKLPSLRGLSGIAKRLSNYSWPLSHSVIISYVLFVSSVFYGVWCHS
jgi:hypothetical protein